MALDADDSLDVHDVLDLLDVHGVAGTAGALPTGVSAAPWQGGMAGADFDRPRQRELRSAGSRAAAPSGSRGR